MRMGMAPLATSWFLLDSASKDNTSKLQGHSLTQQGVWPSFGHPNPQKSPFTTPKIFCKEFLKLSISSTSFHFFHINIIPLALYMDIMLSFIELIHVYGCNLSILWSPLKRRMPKNSTTATFGYPVSKSLLRPSTGVHKFSSPGAQTMGLWSTTIFGWRFAKNQFEYCRQVALPYQPYDEDNENLYQ